VGSLGPNRGCPARLSHTTCAHALDREQHLHTSAGDRPREVEAEQFERNVHVIRDDALTAYANRVAARILLHLPPTELKIRAILRGYRV
jgi:hypothetical protein